MIIALCAIMELTQLRAFVEVARAGGFAAAAETRNVAPSSVTRAVAGLERSVGVRLFQRTTRKVSLTEAGERLLARIGPALEEIEAAQDDVAGAAGALSGRIRVSASVSFGQRVIAPRLDAFCAQNPSLSVDLLLSDSIADLIGERIDLAVRHGALADNSLIAQRLKTVRYRLVASPGYLKGAPPITHPNDVARHRCVTFSYPAFQSHWRFRDRAGPPVDVKIDAHVTLTNALAIAECVKRHMGLAVLADWMVDDDIANGALTEVLPGWAVGGVQDVSDAALWLMLPSRSFVPAKTVRFAEFLRQCLSG